jgi:alpha-ketoglutarate-dependent taurine dioxygenase
MKTGFLNQQELPLVIEPDENADQKADIVSLISICQSQKEFLRKKLLRHGALLFRGFSVQTPEDFGSFVSAFSGKELLDYVGGASPRVALGGNVYTSTEYPSKNILLLHNELSYSDRYPEQLYFCCLVAPQEGGETPLGDSRRILKRIDKKVVEEFKRKKVKYIRNLSGDSGSGYSWQDAFETNNKSQVENHCRESDIDFRWKDDSGLWLSQIRPATTVHPETKEEVWFNQAIGFHPRFLPEETYQFFISQMPEEEFRLNSFFGDNTPFDISNLEHIREILHDEMVIFPWQAGDILVLDNLLTAHGRMPFSGERKIILAMT